MATLTVENLRHFEPYRMSEYSDESADLLKVIVPAGMWHLGNRYGNSIDTTLTITDDTTSLVYAKYNKSVTDTVTIHFDTPANVLALLTGSTGYLYHVLGSVTTLSGDITAIDESWQGGDIITSEDSTAVDELSLTVNNDAYGHPTYVDTLSIYGYNYGNPSTSGNLTTGDPVATAPKADVSTLLWKTFPDLASTYASIGHNHDTTYAAIVHNHTHYYLTDIAAGKYAKHDHYPYWMNATAIAGQAGVQNITYTQNYCESIGNSSAALTVHLNNRSLENGTWKVNNATESNGSGGGALNVLGGIDAVKTVYAKLGFKLDDNNYWSASGLHVNVNVLSKIQGSTVVLGHYSGNHFIGIGSSSVDLYAADTGAIKIMDGTTWRVATWKRSADIGPDEYVLVGGDDLTPPPP